MFVIYFKSSDLLNRKSCKVTCFSSIPVKYSKENNFKYFYISRNLQKRFIKPMAKLKLSIYIYIYIFFIKQKYKTLSQHEWNATKSTNGKMDSPKKLQRFVSIFVPWEKLYTKINEIENVKNIRKCWEGILKFQ